jgi:hypothetical protein
MLNYAQKALELHFNEPRAYLVTPRFFWNSQLTGRQSTDHLVTQVFKIRHLFLCSFSLHLGCVFCSRSSQASVKSDSAWISLLFFERNSSAGWVWSLNVKLVINLRARLRRTADLRIQRLVLNFAIESRLVARMTKPLITVDHGQ